MRRKDKEIKDQSDIEDIIKKSQVCRIGMVDGNIPYIVPLCFGFKDNEIYFHCSLKGKKIDILTKNNNVCFEFDINSGLVEGVKGCDWSMKYQSVVGFGKAYFVKDYDSKVNALDIIVSQYSDKKIEYPEQSVNGTAIIRIEIKSMSGKKSRI